MPQGRERLPKHVGHTDRLHEEAAQVGKERAVGVGLVVDLPPVPPLAEDSRGDKRRQLPLETGRAHRQVARELRHEPPPIRRQERGREEALSDPRKQGVQHGHTHHEYMITH